MIKAFTFPICLLAILSFSVDAAPVRTELKALQESVHELQITVQKLEQRVWELEGGKSAPEPATVTEPIKSVGQQKFEGICMACHKYQPSPPMLAPPIFAIRDHYNRVYENDDAWIEAVVSYVKKPTVEASLMPGAQRKFGLMPALPLPDEDLRSIAEFLRHADLDKPGWYDQHYNEEHGSGN